MMSKELFKRISNNLSNSIFYILSLILNITNYFMSYGLDLAYGY